VLFPSATILAAPDVVAGLAQDARSSDDPRPPALPSISIIGHLQLSIAGEPVQLVHVAPAHTSGDVFAWFPASRTLVTGDLFDNTYYPHIDPWNGGTYVGYLQSLEKLSEYPASVVIPGHGPRGTHADVVATRDFLRGIRDAVLTARASGLSGDAIVEKLSPPTGERLSNLGVFSSRAGVVRGFVNELPRQ
jgi:glyoxylase-like metal-dependent hydrolase (beta-lactamase superfamily II)